MHSVLLACTETCTMTRTVDTEVLFNCTARQPTRPATHTIRSTVMQHANSHLHTQSTPSYDGATSLDNWTDSPELNTLGSYKALKRTAWALILILRKRQTIAQKQDRQRLFKDAVVLNPVSVTLVFIKGTSRGYKDRYFFQATQNQPRNAVKT